MNPASATQTISEPERQPAITTAIDLRSDTVTKPSPEMRRAMFEAETLDDAEHDGLKVAHSLTPTLSSPFGRGTS